VVLTSKRSVPVAKRATRGGRRTSGAVDRLPSGRWRARFTTPDGRRLTATRATKTEADSWLAMQTSDVGRGTWVDPRRARTTFGEYATQWLEQRTDLRARTKEDYGDILRVHLIPKLGERPIGKLSPADVRAWYAGISAVHPGRARKVYRHLRAILNTAIADEIIVRNPCRVRGAGQDRSAERPVATVAEVGPLAESVEPRWRTLILFAAWCGLRRGELLALRRKDIDMLHGIVTVERSVQYLRGGEVVLGPPKTAAGRRRVVMPPHLLPEVEHHLDTWVKVGPEALVFTSKAGDLLHPYMVQRAWAAARKSAGVEHLRFHDVRHTGNTLAAATGASTKELMAAWGTPAPRRR
jgi:integrase